ncbi:IQ domain-containing protein E [Ctenodactylus gundi]
MSLSTASETGDDSLSAITFESDVDVKTRRKGFHKPPPTSPKSPYYSKPRKVASWRSVRTAGSMPLSSRTPLTPQKPWPGTPRQGHAPGTALCREKEDMYDEIVELKKTLHTQKSDVDLMRTKLRRLEEESHRKDRQIEQLLNPGRGPDFVRTLAETRPDTSWVVSGLRQRIFRLEQQCQDKDTTIRKLQSDMKTTNLEEMRVAMETYYEEIRRLQTLLASSEITGKKPPVEKKAGTRRQRMGSALLSLSRSVQELTEENQSLKEDLDRVLSDSPTVSRTKGYVDWSKPRLLRRIAELEKKLSSVDSEKLQASGPARQSPSGRVPTQLCSHDGPKGQEHLWASEPVRLSPSGTVPAPPRSRDGPEKQERLRALVRSLRAERSELQAQLLQKDEDIQRLRQAKADLEKELGHVRAEQQEQQERQERQQALPEEVQALASTDHTLEETRTEKNTSASPGVMPELTACTGGRGTQTQASIISTLLMPGIVPVASGPAGAGGQSRVDTLCRHGGWVFCASYFLFLQACEVPHVPSDSGGEASSEKRREAAARTLQARWKVRQHSKKKAARDEAATVLQAAFRGHLARATLLPSTGQGSEPPSQPGFLQQCSPEPLVPRPVTPPKGIARQEEAIILIQSVLRGHLSRARYSTACPRLTGTTSGRASSPSHPEPASPPSLADSPGKEDSEASGGEAAEDEPGEPAVEPPPTEDASTDDSDDDIIIAPAGPSPR